MKYEATVNTVSMGDGEIHIQLTMPLLNLSDKEKLDEKLAYNQYASRIHIGPCVIDQAIDSSEFKQDEEKNQASENKKLLEQV